MEKIWLNIVRKRIKDYDKVLPVLEVYRCVQSEGSRFGRPTIAVRTTGCTHRCFYFNFIIQIIKNYNASCVGK